MTILTPLALQNHDVLRCLAANTSGGDNGWTSRRDLATFLKRDESNLGKSLKALHEAGLIYQPASWNGLTDQGREALAALDRAEDTTTVRVAQAHMADAPAGHVLLTHAQIYADAELNPRKDFDSDDAQEKLAELASSIEQDGLLENLVVRPPRPGEKTHLLVAGERRWRAIGILIEGGVWSAATTFLCKLVDIDDAAHRRLALIENLQRVDLSALEEAHAVRELMEIDGADTAGTATALKRTQRWVQHRLTLLKLSPKLTARLHDKALTVEDARQIPSIWDRLPAIKQAELERGAIRYADAKRWLDEQPEPLSQRAKLVLAELFEAMKTRPAGTGYYPSTLVQASTVRKELEGHTKVSVKLDDPALTELTKRLIVDPPRTTRREGIESGLHHIELGWNSERKANEALPGVTEVKRRKVLLHELRVEAGHDPAELSEGQFVTPWLNGPFVEDPAVVAEIEAARAAKEARNAEIAAQNAEAARKREEAADMALQAAEAAHAMIVTLAAQTPAAAHPAFTSILEMLALPAPWAVGRNGGIVAADRADVLHGVYYGEMDPADLARRKLMVVAINLAAGVPFAVQPDDPAEQQRDLDGERATFVQDIAGEILELTADDEGDDMLSQPEALAKAEAGFAAFLQREGLIFGDDDWDWEDTGAQAVARAILADRLDEAAAPVTSDQIDLEEAIADAAPAGGDELSPALQSLVDGTAKPIAEAEA